MHDTGEGSESNEGNEDNINGGTTARNRKRDCKDSEVEEFDGETTAPLPKARKTKKPKVSIGELDDVAK